MSELEQLGNFIRKTNAKTAAEINVLKLIMQTIISRHAREYENPEEYVMTLISPIVSTFDATKADNQMSDIGFEHAVSFCNEIETAALDLLLPDDSEN